MDAIRTWARRLAIAAVVVAIVLALVAPAAFERLATAAGQRLGHALEVTLATAMGALLKVAEPVLVLLIVMWGFRIMLRGIFGGGGSK